MSDYDRSEIETHFSRWREAVDRHDLDAMASMLTPDARGGNAVFGLSEGRDAVMRFMDHWPQSVPNRSLWHVIDGARVVNKWRETLPGTPPDDRDYHSYQYDGISELIYAGDQKWNFMYGLPDQVGLMRVYAQWRKDGQATIHGEVYPGLP
ncbi:MAG: nuclear transport factor 2 family protein [Deltaproteobacteria bacterium]|nr:nuclear transport factor 2 family protein [Deltaproteobacteria bacterium]